MYKCQLYTPMNLDEDIFESICKSTYLNNYTSIYIHKETDVCMYMVT